MLTLGIETSQIPGGVALSRDGATVEERQLDADRRHAQTLVPEMHELLQSHGHAPPDCDIVAVSIGPGSFTGLRVGVTCAKTFAYATGAKVAAVSTLLAVAHNAPAGVDRLYVISDAQRQQVFLQEFTRNGDLWQPVADITIADAPQWIDARQPADVVTGPALQKYAKPLTSQCRVLDPNKRNPQAGIVAQLGEQAVARGEEADPWTLEPLYFRKSAAEETWDKRRTKT